MKRKLLFRPTSGRRKKLGNAVVWIAKPIFTMLPVTPSREWNTRGGHPLTVLPEIRRALCPGDFCGKNRIDVMVGSENSVGLSGLQIYRAIT